MNIDLGSLFFNASIRTGGGTPSWGTALGQSAPDYKLTYPGASDILVAMDYCYCPLSNEVSCKLGKGGKEYKALESQGADSKYEIIKAALFSDVQIKIENSLIPIDKPFALLVTKENENTHRGRRTLKYSDSVCIGEFCNKDFFDAVQNKLGGPDACWFAYAIDVEEQQKLTVSVVKVSDSVKTYSDAESRKKEWNELLPEEIQIQNQTSEISTPEKEMERRFVLWMGKKLKPDGSHYDDQYQSQTKNYLKHQIGVLVPSSNAGNLFRFYNANIFEIERKSILQNQNFQKIDAEKHNQLSAAMSLFLAFLKTIQCLRYAQTIFYGVPGCGKSHTVDKIINNFITEFNNGKDDDSKITYEKQVVRAVFHPDYCNADFVGQIMPKKKENTIDYEFKPGPLANIIRKAYLNPSKPYFLIIEEINRGNAAAIFGEMFQLLDRYKEGEHSSNEEIRNENYNYTEGWSKYSINNDDVNGFILLGGESSVTEKDPGVDYESDSCEAPKSAIKIPSRNLHFSTYCGIRLPPNLSIYATMNTSDQNVFTLDNAFQRRWEMKQISNDLAHDDPAADTTKQYDQIIGNTNVKWGEFREKINEIIMQSAEENGLSSMEDKRLGGWFITPKKEPNAAEGESPKITDEAFAEKVLKYLWDDAFKFDRPKHFGEIKTLEDLTKKFKEDHFKVFEDNSIKNLQQRITPPTANNDDSVDTPANDPTQNDGDG